MIGEFITEINRLKIELLAPARRGRRKKVGDKNRITHDYSDGTLEKIMRDVDSGKLKGKSNWFMEHPAYYGTSIQQKDPRKKNKCEECSYYEEPELGFKKVCQFPWFDPKDYDMAVFEFLPCQKEKK